MKTPLSNLPDEKAKKELKRFLIIGYVCAVVAFFALGFLSVVGLAFGARCFVLSNHKGNSDNPKIKQLKIASIALVALSAIEFWMYLSQA
jgi:mannose/fructose/N-acetylgalactosamine-specific phosphotransferase system component IIC